MSSVPHPVIAHNFYRSGLPSGENRVVQAEVAMLRRSGMQVETVFRYSDDIRGALGKSRAGISALWSRDANAEFSHAVRAAGANVLHVHNLYPLVSPSIIRAAKRLRIPVVASVHNYRLGCPVGTLYRNGSKCVECCGRVIALPAVRHACYQDSTIASAAVATAMALHRPLWSQVDLFLAVSTHIAEFLGRIGIPAGRIRVKPNAAPDPGPKTSDGAGVLFAGRLDAGKGIELLLAAWSHCEVDPLHPLVIVGDGPLRPLVVAATAARPDITYLGPVGGEIVGELIDKTAATCVPSTLDESFSMAFLEAIAHGRPVLATKHGALGALVDDTIGWSVSSTPSELAAALAVARRGDRQRGRQARQRFENAYTEEANFRALSSAYLQVLQGNPA